MKTKAEILEILRKQKPELVRRYGIKRLALFGSYAREDQRDDSDVDILVIGIDHPSLIAAARALYLIGRPFLIPEMPFFKLGVKFRTVEEITSSRITSKRLASRASRQLATGPLCRSSDL